MGSSTRAKLAACAAIGMVLSVPAKGQDGSTGTFKTGAQLYSSCSSANASEVETCEWYLMGVHDAIVLHQDLEWIDYSLCFPDEFTAKELREVVVGYLARSSDRSFTAVSMVHNAMADAYSC